MAWEEWLDVVLPRECAGCARPGVRWCPGCAGGLGSLVPRLEPSHDDELGLVAVGGSYEGLLKSAVLAHKRGPQPALRDSLSLLYARTLAVVAGVLRAAGTWRPPVLMVPVPPSARRPHRWPMVELAPSACRSSADVHVAPLLVPRRRRRPQKGLDAHERARNLSGAWWVDPAGLPTAASGAPRATMLVIDDVWTTGASLREAVACLRASGVAPVASIVLARAVGL